MAAYTARSTRSTSSSMLTTARGEGRTPATEVRAALRAPRRARTIALSLRDARGAVREEQAMVFAADYPFLDILWTMLIFFAWVVWIWIMIVILTDVFRRGDIGGWAKAAWVVFLIVLPFLGALVYLIAQHKEMAERRTKDVREQQAMVDDHIRSVAATDGPATEIAN